MMVDRYKYFRWTGRTAWITFAYVVAFPTLIGYYAYTTDVGTSAHGVILSGTVKEQPPTTAGAGRMLCV